VLWAVAHVLLAPVDDRPMGTPDLRFSVGDRVLANVGEWTPATVVAVWDDPGEGATSLQPYRLRIDKKMQDSEHEDSRPLARGDDDHDRGHDHRHDHSHDHRHDHDHGHDHDHDHDDGALEVWAPDDTDAYVRAPSEAPPPPAHVLATRALHMWWDNAEATAARWNVVAMYAKEGHARHPELFAAPPDPASPAAAEFWRERIVPEMAAVLFGGSGNASVRRSDAGAGAGAGASGHGANASGHRGGGCDGLLVPGGRDALVVEEFPQIYSFPLFTQDFCAQILEEIENFEVWLTSCLCLSVVCVCVRARAPSAHASHTL
jgi:hypothetical protein